MAEPLKLVYSKDFIQRLGGALQKVHPGFPLTAFRDAVFTQEWPALELKQRMHHITRCLHQALPKTYREALALLAQVEDQFKGLPHLVFPNYVEQYGMDDWDASLPALAQFTRGSSSEFAIRPFIKRDQQRMLTQMEQWSKSSDYHLRRLASEGCRPRLPWAQALPELQRDPAPILPILEGLKQDPEEYVRRSVANNLNDIAKDHPDLVLEIAARWLGLSKDTDRLIKHACRTLLKAGDSRAMALFGFGPPKNVTVSGLQVAAPIRIGGRTAIRFAIHLEQAHDSLRLEYGVYYLKANGNHTRKVFKISEKAYDTGTTDISREHAFRDLTTRRHYPGEHRVSIILNGVEVAETRFNLEAP